MKRLLILFLFLAASASAQTTTVTGTITDPQGNPYQNGTASAQKVVSSGQNPGPPFNTTTNAAGLFSFSGLLALPSPASYIFTICAAPVALGPKANPTPVQQCFANTVPIAISGASQDVSATLNALAPTLGPQVSNITGNALTATSLQNAPAQCGASSLATGITSSGTANCTNSPAVVGVTSGKVNGICHVDGTTNATLAAAVTCAGTNGVVDVPMFAVPTLTAGVTIPAGVTLKFEGSSPGLIQLGNFNLTINGPLVAPATQIFSYTGSGVVSVAPLQELRAIWFSGSDMLVKISNAYAALQAPGTIFVDPQASGTCWPASTSITTARVGIYAMVRGSGATAFTGSIPTGDCINFTPTTAVTMWTIDWGNTASFTPSHGISGLHFINNNITTNGGGGSSATGIAMGITNLGAPQAAFTNMAMTGFGVAFSNPNSLSFGQQFSNDIFASNTVALNLPGSTGGGGLEREDFLTCHFNANGSAITTTGQNGPVNLKIEGGSFDSNTVIGVSNTSTGVNDFTAIHFENFGMVGSFVPYVNVSNHLHIALGDALDDAASGTNTTAWFTANTMEVFGQVISSPNRTTNGSNHVYNVTGGAGVIFTENINPTKLNPYFMGSVVGSNSGGAQDPTFNTGRIIYAQSAPPGTCSVPTGGGTGPTCTVNGGDSGGTIIMTIGTGAPAATGTTTFFFHSALANPEAGNTGFCTFTLSNNGAGKWNGQAAAQENLSSSAGVTVAWSNNAVALSVSTAYWINYTCGGR